MISQELREQFLVRKDITFLNFGSFGGCPKPIFERYQQYQLELEQEPVEFIVKTGLTYLKNTREALGKYLNCAADDLVMIANPSYAVNIVAKSLALKPGDEILTTDLEYGACDRTFEYYCNKAGAKYVRQPISLPLTTKEQFVADFFKGLTPKTKLVFISHITSSTALRFPVEEICKIAKEKGIMTFVDGAHAPGQIPLDLSTLQVDIYTGACHKWMMAPKGCTFFYVHRSCQHLFDPLVISWGYKSTSPSHSSFLDYHQTQGTRDFSAFCTIPTVIDFIKENNWVDVAKECRALTHANALPFCKLLNSNPNAPITDEFILQLFSIPIKTTQPVVLKDLLFEKYKIEIPVMPHENKVFLRYSIQAYNTQQDLDILTDAINNIIKTTNLIEI